MDQEIFDVVDAQDRVIGSRPRAEVHALHLLHRSIHVLVFDAAGRLFLQRRAVDKDEYPGRWDASVSGHLKAGEDYDAAAVREAREELGLILTRAPAPLFKLAAGPATGFEFSTVYRLVDDGPFQLDPVEIERGDWVAVDAVDAWMAARPADFTDPLRLIWARLRRPAVTP